MTPQRFIELSSKKLSGSITPVEAAELDVWLQDEKLALRFQQLKKFWDEGKAVQLPDTDAAWAHLSSQTGYAQPLPVRRTRRWMPLSIAAAVIVAVSGWLLIRYQAPAAPQVAAEPAAEKALIEKQNGKGVRSVIVLADGSKVWLNADSKLQYPKTFEGHNREVVLSGEAFFDVTRNPQKPFIIHLSAGKVQVLGTSFNIKAYPGTQKVETSVVTGKVAFIPAAGPNKAADTVLLTPNQKAVQSLATGTVTTIPTLSREDRAWTEGRLVFKDASMREITAELERYFGKEVVVLDEAIYEYHLTGSFQNNSAEEILYYLSKTKPFTYKVTETQMILSLVR